MAMSQAACTTTAGARKIFGRFGNRPAPNYATTAATVDLEASVMLCPKCKRDVNPVKVMGTRADTRESGVSVQSGFYNQCPECSLTLPDDELTSTPPPPPEAELAFRPMVMPRPAPVPTQAPSQPQRSGSIVDDARAELAQVDADIASLEGQIAAIKTEIQLKKSHRKGLLSMVSVYERAARPKLREVAQ
jgi:hypothetical protein